MPASSDPRPGPKEPQNPAGCDDALAGDDIPWDVAEEDIPWDEETWGGCDLDTGMPVELLALSDQELHELYAAAQVHPAPARPVPPSWPLSYRTAYLPDAPGERGETPECGEADGRHPVEGAASGEGVAGRRVVASGFAEDGELDEAPAGIALAAFADDAYAELTRVDDDALIGLMRGWRRVTSWAQARELAVVTELARRRPADGYPPGDPGQLPVRLDEYVAEEIAPALTLTSRAAGTHLDLALALAGRPRTAAALESGQIDLAKTLIILGALAPLETTQAAAVEAAILPLAPGLTTAQLQRRLTRLVQSVDPDATRRRREAAEKQAYVACWTDPEGTATLAGRFLPPAQVLAADRRLCAIAKAWKKQGGQGGLDLLRAHAYLALLLGLDTDVPPASLLPDAQPPEPQGTGANPKPQDPGSGHEPQDPGAGPR